MSVQDTPHDNSARTRGSGGRTMGADVLSPAAHLMSLVQDISRGNCDRTRVQRDAVAAFMIRIASAGILYLSQIVLARLMGSFEYGIYVFVWTWVMVLGGLSHLGFSTVMIRLIPEYKVKRKDALLRGLLFGGRLISLATSTLVMLSAMMILYLFEDQVTSDYIMPVFLALVCVPMFTLADVQDGIGRANAWMGIALIPPYILRPLILLASMFMFLALEFEMTARTAAGAAIVASWLSTLVQTLVLNRLLANELEGGPRKYAIGNWYTVSLPLIAITGCEIVLQNTDVLVISRYLSPTDVAIYFAAAKTMALIMFVHYAVGSAAANRFAAIKARGDDKALRVFVRDAVNWTFWPSAGAAFVILALGKPLLWLFGPQFTAGYPVMFVLVIGFLLRSAMGPAEFLLNMVGEHRACAVNMIVTAIANVSLNLMLVVRFGLMGAATATALSLGMIAILNYLVARRRLGLKIAIWQNL